MITSRVLTSRTRVVLGVLVFSALILAACGGSVQDSWAGVAAGPDMKAIYIAHDKHVTAINPGSGAILWEFSDGDAKFFAVPTAVDDVLYVGDYEGRMHALSAEGQPLWRYEPAKETILGPISVTPKDRVIGGVAVDSDKVYFGLGSRNVVAVSRTTGKEMWTFETNHGVWSMPLYIPANPEEPGSKAIVYVASLDHRLYALDAETGKELWRKDLGGAAPGDLVYDPVRNRVYVGTFLSELVAVDLATHNIVDRFETEGWVWGSPAFDEDILYFGDLAGILYAVRVTDEGFEQVWKQPVAEDAIRSTPILTDGLVIAASKDKNIYAVSKENGASQWQQDLEGEALTELVFVPASPDDPEAHDLVVVGTDKGDQRFVALAVDSGAEIWTYSD